jgi:hypothetical protein
MAREDAEALLRAMTAPLSGAQPGQPLPGLAFSREAVANAFVMLGLLPEARAEEILAEHRQELQAKGFHFGVLTGELSVRPGAHGFQDAQAAGSSSLARLPLAVAAGPVPLSMPAMDLNLAWATLTPAGTWLRLQAARPATGSSPWPAQRPRRILRRSRRRPPRPLRTAPGHEFGEEIRSRLSVADNLGRKYRVLPKGWGSTLTPGPPGERIQTWHGELLAEPEPHNSEPASGPSVQWLELATRQGSPVRVAMPAPASVRSGTAGTPWPTPAECYLAALASVTSMSISTDDRTVQLDTAQIVAAVADALLRTGAVPPDSALLSGGSTAAASGQPEWRGQLMHRWARHAQRSAQAGEPHRAGLAVPLPLRQATAVIESITAHEDLVSLQLYGHPWVRGEYWPMITPCFQVRAVDDTGAEHEGVSGAGGGSPEGSWEFWFWPPLAPAARQIRVTVSTLWEAAWVEISIPGRPG